MFFTSGIIIAFFCFAFYLIWNQFLRKDTRLNTGLQVLRKKIGDLENLSLNVESQVDRQMSLVGEKTRKMESLLRQSKELCDTLEKHLQMVKALEPSPEERATDSSHVNPPEVKPIKNHQKEAKKSFSKNSPAHLKMVKENPLNKQKRFQFGKSPFTHLDFIESFEDNLDSSP